MGVDEGNLLYIIVMGGVERYIFIRQVAVM